MCAPSAMDSAGGDDILEMERVVGPTFLTQALKTAPVGAMRPNSWSFWHVRLGLFGSDGEFPPERKYRFAKTDAGDTFSVRSPRPTPVVPTARLRRRDNPTERVFCNLE